MNQDQLPPKSTVYHNHVELTPKSPGRKNNMVNDDPNITPVTTTLSPPTIDIHENISDNLPIIDVTFLHSQTIPSHLRQTSFRAKQNSVTDFFADIIGLASYDQVEKLQRNEEQIQKVQEETTKEVKTILSQTNAIVDSLKEQSDKLATLYKDETSVKNALSTLLQDENNIMSQLAKIAASLEVMTDVSTEFMVFSQYHGSYPIHVARYRRLYPRHRGSIILSILSPRRRNSPPNINSRQSITLSNFDNSFANSIIIFYRHPNPRILPRLPSF
jgi:hypothetical protein